MVIFLIILIISFQVLQIQKRNSSFLFFPFYENSAIILFVRGYSSVGRAMRSQRIGQGFESPYLHNMKKPRI